MAVEVPAFLKKKVGPLPVGVWVLIGGAGIGAIYLYRKRTGAGPGLLGSGLQENEADDVYGVPIDSPDDEFAPYSPAPSPSGQPGTGGFVITPLPYDPVPGQPDSGDTLVAAPQVVRTCTEPTQVARLGAYSSAPNRECPQGWHKANRGPCVGRCIRNTV